ncbi:MAG TPA: DUF1385 domain-containing protein [Abditibacteriaceae bacterium]|jgi:uncharacterized protein YqhQ
MSDKAKNANANPLPAWLFALTVVCSLGLGMMLFVALPHAIAGYVTDVVTGRKNYGGLLFNLLEGAVKTAIFVSYIAIIGRKKDICRVFEYHGAEHKVVFAVENGRELTPAGARDFDTPHPRCGTNFAFLTILVSILCFSLLPETNSKLIGIAMRFGCMVPVAGVSYEIIKLTTHPRWGRFANFLMTPGLWLQRLTTRQPDDAQLEVSCAAMRAVLDAEQQFAQSEKAA